MELEKAKYGLGLSGGGFRASLFHIGVLASLAENDVLKDIEVISCVSGGSIIGAYYYLELKELLEAKKDKDISKEDYVLMIKKIEREFLESVQTNIRVQCLSNLFCNLKMIFKKDYTRSDRLAELYDKYFYNRYKENLDARQRLSNGIVHPLNEISGNNLDRTNKIPKLILNATNLNTGSNWTFTSEQMGDLVSQKRNKSGEDPIFEGISFWDEEISPSYSIFSLGIAVAASSCVPGFLTPIALYKLSNLGVIPRIVDGGIYNNQGLDVLFAERCTKVIVSDASRQINFESDPRSDPIGVTKRVNSILMNRIRTLAFDNLKKGDNENIILHLKEGLKPEQINFMNKLSDENRGKTEYEVDKEVQSYLSKIRTDLDSFSDIEAYSLMYCGYRMSNYKLVAQNFKEQLSESEKWKFLDLKEYCEGNKKSEYFLKNLKIGSETVFKVGKISWLWFLVEVFFFLISLSIIMIPITLLHIFFPIYINYFYYLTAVMLLTSLILNFLGFSGIIKNNILFKFINTLFYALFFAVPSWILCNLYLTFINRRFLTLGSIDTLNKNSSN